MTESLFSKYKMLKEYLSDVYTAYSGEALDDLEYSDPTYYIHIRNCEAELGRLTGCIEQWKEKQNQLPNFSMESKSSKPEQLTLDLFPAMPKSPKQTVKQKLQNSTMFTPLLSIVEKGYNESHKGINWPHYENMLKLFALSLLIRGEMTPQQKQDKMDLETAIETVGNAKYKKKHLSATEIMEKNSSIYMRYGKNVIRAMNQPDPIVSERCLKDLRSEIQDTRNEYNAIQLHKTMSKARTIYMNLQSRYKQK